MSLRDQQKAERRERILDAAEAILRERGAEGLSMRDLAKRARVGHATPYNLFGDKANILSALFERAFRQHYARFDTAHAKNALEGLYAFYEVLLDILNADAAYHRAVLLALGAARERALDREPARNTVRRVRAAMERAMEQHLVRRNLHPGLVAQHILAGQAEIYRRWVAGDIDNDDLRRHYLFNMTLILLSIATDASRPFLESQLARLTSEFAHHYIAHPERAHPRGERDHL